MPFYEECKRATDVIPYSIKSVAIDGDLLKIVYVVDDGDVHEYNRGKFNTYTVTIDLPKSSLSKIMLLAQDPFVEITCEDGIEIHEENGLTNKKYPFLVEKWCIKCNDSPLCNRLYNALNQTGKFMINTPASGSSHALAGNSVSNGGGNSWSLPGRQLKGRLAMPSYSGNEQGVIVVTIRVDASGRVINANIGSGTTIESEEMRRAAINAAKKNEFSSGNSVAYGSITYKFMLN